MKLRPMVKGGTMVTVAKESGNGFTPVGHEITFEVRSDGKRGLVTEPASAELLCQHARGRRQGDNFDVMSQTGMQVFHIKRVTRSRKKAETALLLVRGPEAELQLTK